MCWVRIDAELPSPADLPTPDVVRGWHDDLVRAGQLQETASTGPVRTLRITAEGAERGLQLAEVLHALALAHPVTRGAAWMEPFRRAAIRGESGAWPALLRERLKEWASLDAERVELAQRSVELPSGFLDNDDACEAVIRAAAGKPLWPMLSMGKGLAKALVSSTKLDGASVRKDDVDGWRHVAAVVAHTTRRQEVTARWQSFTVEIGAPAAPNPKAAVDLARTVLHAADNAYAYRSHLSVVGSGSIGLDTLSDDPGLCRSLADQIQAAAGAVRLTAVREHIRRNIGQFQRGSDRTSVVVWQFFEQAIGNAEVPGEKVESIWRSALQRIAAVKARAGNFATIIGVTELIAQAGAPGWAKRARTEPALDNDPVLRSDWRDAWDHAAADAKLASIDARDRLAALAREREDSDKRCRKLFAELVRERTFYELDRRLSPSVKAALVEFVRALARIGKGTGITAGRHRRAAREAMARCYVRFRVGSCRPGALRSNSRPISACWILSLSTKRLNPM
jgi:hypothetical protein